MKKLFLYVTCSLPDAVTTIPGLFMWLFWGHRWRVEKTEHTWAFVFNLKGDSWPSRTWYKGWGGTTFGRCIMMSETDDALHHEFVHVEQYEAGCFFGALLTVAAPVLFPLMGYWFPVFMWAASSWLFTGCAMITAWLRGEKAYRGSHREEAAYALTREYEAARRGES